MTVRSSNEEANREKQQARIDEIHSKEEEARPDPMHRAIVFLLNQAILNNRDCKREASYHLEQLDNRLGIPEKIAEVAAIAPIDAVGVAKDTNNDPAAGQVQVVKPVDTAKKLRTSSRFKRNT